MLKRFCLTLIIVLFCIMFSGCFDRREVDDLAYVIAIGLDKAKTNNVKVSLQFAIPMAIGSGGGGEGGNKSEGGGEGSKSVSLITVEAPSLLSGLNMVNNFVSKQVNLSHAKVIVFSEEIAKEGMMRYVQAISKMREMRPNIYMAISRGSAEEYLRSVQPIMELNPAKYYEMIFQGYKRTGFTADTQFHKFYMAEKCFYGQTVATLAGVNQFKSESDFDLKNSTYKNKERPYPFEGDFVAGGIPKISKMNSEIMGLAVFNKGKMIGELDGEETTFYLMSIGNYNYAYMTIPDPESEGNVVVLNVKKSRNPAYKVEIIDGMPVIKLRIRLEADIMAIQSGINYESAESIPKLERAYEKYIKDGMINFLNKTSKEFNSDICEFGKFAKSKFLTWEDWVKYNWSDKYKSAQFEVDVDLKIRRTGLTIRSTPLTYFSAEGR